MRKDLLNLRNQGQQIIPQISWTLEHIFDLLENRFVKTGWEVGLHLDIAINNEVAHLFVVEEVFLIVHPFSFHVESAILSEN